MSLEKLAAEKCIPCEGATPMADEEAQLLVSSLPGWTLKDQSVEKVFGFETYLSGVEFVSKLARIAEAENHHPDIWLGWRRVRVTFSTHAIKGLSRNDFMMAAKTEVEFSRITRQPGTRSR